MFLKPFERRLRLPARTWAKCFLNWPDGDCALPHKAPTEADFQFSKSNPTPTSFRAAVRKTCSTKTRREGSAPRYERLARAGLAKPSAPCTSTCLVRRPCKKGLGNLRLHTARLHPALLKSGLHVRRRPAPGRGAAAPTMDAPKNASLLAVTRRRRTHDLCPGSRPSADQRRLAGRSGPAERRPVCDARHAGGTSCEGGRTHRSHPNVNRQ
jgi:hypothetical protein